jgi:predicted ATPase/DNA-binding SARP family transcriptional activator
MQPLTLTLMGTFHVQHASHTLTEFHSNGVRALLAYLVVEADRPHERTLIGELLWPDEPMAKRLLNLRQALYRLDQAIAPAALPVPFAQTTRQTVQMNPAMPLTLDVRQFLTLIAAARTHHHRRLTVCGPCLAALREAVALYRGDFLAGFSASAPFDEWHAVWSARLRAQMIWALDTLVLHHEQRGEWEEACARLRHWLEREPWCEEAHRRLMVALASDGQRSAALAQYEICRRILARDLDTTPDPATTSLVARLRVSNPATWFAPPYVVPAVETPIMGRATALTAIASQLAAPVGRLLTLVGPGGSGKTRLALAAAAAERGTFTDGVFFVSLVPVTDEAGLIAVIAERMGIPVSVGQSPTLDMLTTFLESREILLVLDNFEPLLAHAPLLSTLRNTAPNLRLLVTSRVPLQILAEMVIHVDGLEPTAGAADYEPGDDPAVALFMHAARRSAPDFAPNIAEIMAISLLCQALGHLPLAIMLAAGLVAQLSPGTILTLVHADLDALESDLRDLPERHRSIRKLFESSWQLLPEKQQQLLAHCTLFAASFNRAAVVAVTTDGEPVSTVLNLLIGRRLAALADHSLLQRISSDRYILHPLVRQFAAEHHALLPTDMQATSRARYRAYFLGLVAQHTDAIIGTAGQSVVELLRTEIADIRLAWRDASQINDIALMGTAVQGLLELVRSGELYATSTFTFAPAIAQHRAHGADNGPARHLLGRLLVAHAETSTLRGDYDAATGAVQEIIQMSDALGQPSLEAEARCVWGKSLRYQGKTQESHAQLETAYRLVRTSADSRAQRWLRCDIHNFLGLTAWNLGHFGGARAHYRVALRLAQSITYSHSESYGYYALAMTTIMQGNYAEAIKHGTAAITSARVNGSRTTEILGLLSVGLAHIHQGEETAAQEVFNTCESLLHLVGYRQAESIMIVFRGMLLLRLGDYAAAQATLAEGLALGQMLKYHLSFSLGLNLMGLLRHLLGDHAGAVAACREAMVIAERAGDIVMVAYALTILGHALAALGDITEATACYERAIAIRRTIRQVHLIPEPLAGLIELALARGDLPTALAHSEAILATYAQTHLAGVEEPSRIILACYRSLLVAKDTRATPFLLQAAQQLRERAARLTNPDQRATFCEAVVANRTLLALAGG